MLPLAVLVALAVPKLLLILLAGAALVAFLLLLGALALGSALGLIALVSWVSRLPVRLRRLLRRKRGRNAHAIS